MSHMVEQLDFSPVYLIGTRGGCGCVERDMGATGSFHLRSKAFFEKTAVQLSLKENRKKATTA